ncbi:SDR family oxidoreductase [Rhodalgimonas zhirmunskyi]|uniref:SDR family NAD(P)-dependent oxidoreductase n=1 Tax=Rhodalgimonas zhirmunskyi TaxID=2964767 RepID=A0AAJ1UAL4_9RHOB|nr:SDR family NAD(P)-dependent oxidoreductase [Rhodoalgimonas zhirmunskyi]MDQ2094363.1 SDR family NAD(P)-dependent oxidoreductase [Rhodoalgimonas zhirmunskyi]
MTALDGKRAWITGGGTGIGAASAMALANAGAEVFVTGRREEPLREVCDKIAAVGGIAYPVAADMADSAAVEAARKEIGQVDILLASAGLNVPTRALSQLTPKDWDHVTAVNLNGLFYASHAVLPGMRERGDGLIMLVSSWAGRYASRLTGAAYNATKRAVIALSESINEEEGPHGIRSTVIMPGEVATPIMKSRPKPPSQAEMDRMLQPEDLAATVEFVARMPPHVCLNEILISPTRNRFYQGFEEL